MIQAILSFATYMGVSLILLAIFVIIYVQFTPYKELRLIKDNNLAAAITLGGAILGFTLPVASSVFYTRSLHEMMLWAVITCLVQLFVFALAWSYAKQIEKGNIAIALIIGSLSIAVGILNAVSISH